MLELMEQHKNKIFYNSSDVIILQMPEDATVKQDKHENERETRRRTPAGCSWQGQLLGPDWEICSGSQC